MLAHILRVCLVTVLAGLVVAAIDWGSREILVGDARVVDGDTLIVSGRTIRLLGIDAPEARQTCRRAGADWSCGEEATRALRRRIEGASLSCSGTRRDKYDRLLATCLASVGTDIGAAQVRDGLAITYDDRYADEEGMARTARRGIWAGTFERPAAWRERHEKIQVPRQGAR